MMEHFYQRVPGHFTWPDFTAFVADRLAKNENRPQPWLAEIGVLNGQSAACMGVELINHGLDAAQMYLVDTNLPPKLLYTLNPVRSVVGPMLQGISWDMARNFEDGFFDYVMIDADHAYESVTKDIAAWLPKVRKGGILAGHDYTPEIPGVCRAVTEAFEHVNVWRGSRFCGPNGDQPPANYYPVWWIEVPR